MPRIDFRTIDDAKDFTPLPEATYACRVDTVEETRTSRGDEMWKIRLVVLSGRHIGRYVFDNIVFSDKALKRVKLICARLGLDVSGEVDLIPDMVRGKTCRVKVETEEYADEEGKDKLRNRVPYAGYETALDEGKGDGAGDGDDADDDLPF